MNPARRRDRSLLMVTRTLRGFGAGALSVVLAIDLASVGYSPFLVGVTLGVAMGAAALWAILLPGRLSGLSRRTLLLLGALAVAVGGLLLWRGLAAPWAVAPALLLGGIVAGGSDVSPLGALEQGALATASDDARRTRAFAEYNFLGYGGTAVGALVAGPLSTVRLLGAGDANFLVYALLGLCLIPPYLRLSAGGGAEPGRDTRPLGPAERRPILRLSALFTVDAFGGGMIANALVAYFLLLRFGAGAEVVGIVISAASLAAGASLLLAVPLAQRFGLLNTIVFTHIPSSVLLVVFSVAPTLLLAGSLWVARATLSQMDVPTRQSYTQAIVPREMGAAAAGYTTAARSAQALGSPVSGALFSVGGPWLAAPFAIAGSVKIAYDLLLFRTFRGLRPPEELGRAAG